MEGKKMEREQLKEAILKRIDKNAKLTAKELSLMLGCEEEEVATAIAEMEADSVICGYPTLIDWDKTNRERVTALIEVKVTPQRGQGFDRIAERIYKFDEVESVYLMSGGFDLTVIIEEKTMRAVSHFVSEKLSTIEAVRGTATHFVLKKYKDHGTVLTENKTDERMVITP